MMKRSSRFKYDQSIELGNRGFSVWAHGKDRKFVYRLEINAAGVAVYSGTRGKKLIANLNWEKLVEKWPSPSPGDVQRPPSET